MTREEFENEIFVSVIRDLLFFQFVNRARDPPCTTLIRVYCNCLGTYAAINVVPLALTTQMMEQRINSAV